LQRNIFFKVSFFLFKKKIILKIFFCFSYDTEALNHQIHQENQLFEKCSFVNSFETISHKKIITGVQKLYTIGI